MPITEDGISSGHNTNVSQDQMNAALANYMLTTAIVSAMSAKMDAPLGLSSQYINGTGALTTFPAIPAAQVNSDWSASSGVAQILNKPPIQTIQRTRVQTDASGNYTWVYPVAYPIGVIPVITAVSESSSSTVPQGVQIVGVPTNISATFKVINLPSTSVLSIVVLGAPTAAQAYIHLTAVAP